MAIDRERIRSNFVFPIKPSTPSTIIFSMTRVSSFSSNNFFLGVLQKRMYDTEAPIAAPRDRSSRVLGRDENDI